MHLYVGHSETWTVETYLGNLLLIICRSWQLLRRYRGHDWLPTKPVDEMELDRNHARSVHGESSRASRGRLSCQMWTSDNVLWRAVTNARVCFPELLRLLAGEVQAPDLQQGVRVPRLVHRSGLVFGPVLHDLYPHGDGHQDLTVWGTPDWGILTLLTASEYFMLIQFNIYNLVVLIRMLLECFYRHCVVQRNCG